MSINPYILIQEFYWLVCGSFSRLHNAFLLRKRVRSFKTCGKVGFISPLCCIVDEAKVELGDRVCIGEFTHIVATGGVRIGDRTLIASHCSITTMTHPVNSINRIDDPVIVKPVEIGENVWIGTGAIILPGVAIADNSIIGAGAVVTKNVPANSVYVGNPARYLKSVECDKDDV